MMGSYRCLAGILGVLVAGAPLEAQEWNSDRALQLVRLATDRRAQQLADSGLVDYQARAHGYLTFLAQLGEGFGEPPRVVKADELALQVYWRAPNLSKQRIFGRRDTTLLPTDIEYHRDHLGIIQNNFPAIIRLGDGDEVSDVPHPLSPAGLGQYEFAIADSLRMTIPGRVISVYEVKVRPRDDRQPRVIGALYLDRDNGQVVRMALSFTRAAFLDRQLEDLFVVLENGLVGASYWLPRRQEIEIRRSATWLDYPVRGIIRGRWEITDYELNTGLPEAMFAGPEIVMNPGARQAEVWPTARILDSLPPDVRAATAEEVRRVQTEVRMLVREHALRRSRGSALAARGISDFARFNRVEGLALGAGLSFRLGSGFSASGRARYGFEDARAKARAALAWQRATGLGVEAAVFDDFREAGDVAERSGVFNSLAAQEFGADDTDPFRARGAALTARMARGSTRWALEVARENQSALCVHAVPARGSFRPALPAAGGEVTRASLFMDQPTRPFWFGTELRAQGEARWLAASRTSVMRVAALVEAERAVAGGELALATIVAGARGTAFVRVQDLVLLGGPVTLPGYPGHSLVAGSAVAQRAELRVPVPFPAVRLGRFGRSSARATLAPHFSAGWLAPPGAPDTPQPANLHSVSPAPAGLYRSAGVSLLFGFDLLRLDVSRGLDAGGGWIVSLDAARAFWRVL